MRKNEEIYSRLFHLTGADTFSAAEEFAYNLQALQRATILGERTKEGVNPWRFFGHGFQAVIPIAKAVNPITKTNWEGIGVQPDIKVAEKDFFDVVYELALKNFQKLSLPSEQKKEIDGALGLLQK